MSSGSGGTYTAGYAANSSSTAGTTGVALRPGGGAGYSSGEYGYSSGEAYGSSVYQVATVVDSQIPRSSYLRDGDSSYAMAGYAYNAGTTTFASKDAYTTKKVTGVAPVPTVGSRNIEGPTVGGSRSIDVGSRNIEGAHAPARSTKVKMEYVIEEREVPKTIQVPREVMEEIMVPKQVPRTITESIMVPKEVPRTIIETIMVPQQVERTIMETVMVPETIEKTVMETVMVPEQRSRTVMEDKVVMEIQQYRVAKPAVMKKKVMVTRPKMVTEEVEEEAFVYEDENGNVVEGGVVDGYASRGVAEPYASYGFESRGVVPEATSEGSGTKLYSSVGYQQGGYLSTYQSTRGSLYGSVGVAYAQGGEYVTPRSGYATGSTYSPGTGGRISPSNDANSMMAKLRADYK